jgi:hypothetical protein
LSSCANTSNNKKIEFNEKKIEELNQELSSNGDFNTYFTSIVANKGNEESYELESYKIHPYQILAEAKEEFVELEDQKKLELVNQVSDVVKDYISEQNEFIACGGGNRCGINEIKVLDKTAGKTEKPDTYTIVFNKDYSIDDYKMKVTYTKNDYPAYRIVKSPDENDSSESNSTTTTTVPTQPESLTLEETSCTKGDNYMYAKGYVKNNSDQFLSFIEVKADFIDSSGNIVDTNYTYAVGSEGLSPNSRKSFDIMTPNNDSVTQCQYYIVDYK